MSDEKQLSRWARFVRWWRRWEVEVLPCRRALGSDWYAGVRIEIVDWRLKQWEGITVQRTEVGRICQALAEGPGALQLEMPVDLGVMATRTLRIPAACRMLLYEKLLPLWVRP